MRKVRVKNDNLRYPTREKVSIKFKVKVKIEISKHSVLIPICVAGISDKCLLGVDFLKMVNLNNIFNLVFEESKFYEKRIFNCSRIKDSEKVPTILNKLYGNNSVSFWKELRKKLSLTC